MIANHDYIDPTEHGWERITEGQIDIQWNTLKPAPDALLEFVACGCKKSKCINKQCRCQKANLKCTDLCGCNNDCENLELDSENENKSSTDDENQT